jgi:hypothetical protein
VERVLVVVSLFDIDESLALLPFVIELLPPAVPEVVSRCEPLPLVGPPLADDGVPVVDPVAVPVERVVAVPVVELPLVVLPACGPDVVVLLLGAPEAPPWPLALVPELEPPLLPACAIAPPHARAAAAEMARIVRVCFIVAPDCVCIACLRRGRRVSTATSRQWVCHRRRAEPARRRIPTLAGRGSVTSRPGAHDSFPPEFDRR